MRLDQPAADRQAEPGAADARAGLQPEELVEDALALVSRDAGAVVGDRDADRAIGRLDLDPDRGAWRGVLGGVLQQVGHHLVDHQVVQGDRRQVFGDRQLERVRGQRALEAVADLAHQLAQVVPVALGTECAALDARHVQQVADQAVEAVRFAHDGGDEAVAILVTPGDVRLDEALGRGLDCGQRGAQVVGDRVEQRGAQLVGAAQHLGPVGLIA